MLPSLSSLVRERSLLWEVVRAAQNPQKQKGTDDDGCTCEDDRLQENVPQSSEVASFAARVADILAAKCTSKNGPAGTESSPEGPDFQELPRELLVAIADHFLESPVWHLCQLGEASPDLGQIFMDEALWQNHFEGRFREASRSPRRRSPAHRTPSPSARHSYGQLHLLEKAFREGLYTARGTLDNPRAGVPVLDLRIAPGATSTSAFAALQDGSIMVYDLDPPYSENEPSVTTLPGVKARDGSAGGRGAAIRATPLRELTPRTAPAAGAPALCCLPIDVAGLGCCETVDGIEAQPLMLVGGFALGRLGAWELPAGRPLVVQPWEQAHQGRISALAALGPGQNQGQGATSILSAASDCLVKAWDLGADRFGDFQQSYPGHTAAVVSVAAHPIDRHTFLTGSHDHSMRLWDVRQGGENAAVARWQTQDWVTCVEFHPTSPNHVLSSDKSVHQWDLRRVGDAPISSVHRHRKLISRFRVDPLRLASCSLDGSVKVSSLEEPSVRNASPRSSPQSSPVLGPTTPPTHEAEASDVCTLRTSADYVLCIDFDATRLLAGSVDGSVEAYDFSHTGHFRASSRSPTQSPMAACGTNPVQIQMTGMPDLEI